MNTAIIVAAGSGKRFASDTPKQFLQLRDKPVIFHTIERFDKCEAIDSIVVVASEDHVDRLRYETAKYGFQKPIEFVVGGAIRVESVKNGFGVVDANTKFVAIHDAARPLVKPEDIARTIASADETGAACLTVPVTDTIKQVEDNRIVATIDRSTLRRAVTPQVFRCDILKRALETAELSDAVTDECILVERMGGEIVFVDGSQRNIKITVPDDLIVAEALLRAENV